VEPLQNSYKNLSIGKFCVICKGTVTQNAMSKARYLSEELIKIFNWLDSNFGHL